METGVDKDSMMRQAQQVWSMLDDMADNDPRAYRSFIDKQMAEKKEFMLPPEPHMCVQTKMLKPDAVPFFINFCTWKRIPPPANPEEPVKVSGSAISQIDDDRGKVAVTAVAFNEKILDEFGKNATNKSDQDTLVQIAMDFIESQHSYIKLNRKYKILERSHKGSVKLVQESLFHAFRAKDKEVDDNIADMIKGFAPLATENPESLLSQLNKENDSEVNHKQTNGTLNGQLSGITLDTKPAKKGLIEEVSSMTVSLPQPIYKLTTVKSSDTNVTKSLLLKIELPGVKSVSECELDISKDDISLFVEEKYELKLSLPSKIIHEEASAKFVKKSSTLTLIMPVES
ncbi:PIH1 domain-containing protein 2 [Mactra antiquata]